MFLERSAWTSSLRGGAVLTGSKLVGLAVHWPGSTTPAYGVESQDTVARRLRGWRDYHVGTRGWSDIGYNIAIDQAGRVWDLRGITRVGAHAASSSNRDANHEYVGVLLILGATEDPTSAMVQAFRAFRSDVFLKRWPGRTAIRGHGDVPGASTACPGPAARAAISSGALIESPEPKEWDEMASRDDVKAAVLEAMHSDHGQHYIADGLALSLRDGPTTRREVVELVNAAVLEALRPFFSELPFRGWSYKNPEAAAKVANGEPIPSYEDRDVYARLLAVEHDVAAIRDAVVTS